MAPPLCPIAPNMGPECIEGPHTQTLWIFEIGTALLLAAPHSVDSDPDCNGLWPHPLCIGRPDPARLAVKEDLITLSAMHAGRELA